MDMLVNIDVPDLARAEAFYCTAFGLTPGRRFGEVVELLGAPVPIYLLQKAAGTSPVPGGTHVRSYSRHWCPVHLDIVVPDIEAAVVQALAAGALQEKPVQAAAWGKLAVLADPYGNGFCLIEFVGRGYDEIAT
jgi:predicted enzyme related to lactoylglutathione lyase